MGRGKMRTDRWMLATSGCSFYKCMLTRTPTYILRGSLDGHVPAEHISVDTCASTRDRCRWVYTLNVPSMYLAHTLE